MVKWLRTAFGPSVKTRLLDQLDLQARQASQDRMMMRDLLIDQARFQAEGQARMAELVSSISAAVMESGKSFNHYLEVVMPKGDNRVRTMTDAEETLIERRLHEERPELAALARSGVPIDGPLTDQLAYQNHIQSDIRAFLDDFQASQAAPPMSLDSILPLAALDAAQAG